MSTIEQIVNKPIKEMTAIEHFIYEKYIQWNQKTGQNSKSGYDAIQAAAELAAMQARIEKLEAGVRRIINGEYDNARTIDAAEKFARELLRGDK